MAEAQRRGGRRQAPRRGRQDAAAGGYDAPEEVPVYGASDAVATYEAAGDDPLAALGNSIPGVPGEDYPIYSEVPESGFTCDGQVDGGQYELFTQIFNGFSKIKTRVHKKLAG